MITDISLFFHVEHENYYLYYFAFGFQHFSFARQIIKCGHLRKILKGFRKLGLFIEQKLSSQQVFAT